MPMMNNLLGLRLANLFQNQNPQADDGSNPNGSDNMAAIMTAMMHPQNPEVDNMRAMLQHMPDRSDPSLQPSLGRRILAGIMAGHDPKAAVEYRDEPYNRALGDWGTKFGKEQALGGLDYKEDNLGRLYTTMMLTQSLNRDKLAEKTKTDESNTAIRKQRADAYAAKQSRPNLKFQEDNKGQLWGVDTTGQNDPQLMTDSDGDPIISGKLPDADRIKLGIEGRKSIEQIRQAGANYRTGVHEAGATSREEDAQSHADDRAANAQTGATERTKLRTPGAGKPPSASQQNQALNNHVAKMLNDHPEWKDYVKYDQASKTYFVTKAKTGYLGNGPSPEVRQQIINEMRAGIADGTATPPDATAAPDTSKPITTQPAVKPTASTGSQTRVKVKSPDGKMTGSIPISQLKDALDNQGYSLLGELTPEIRKVLGWGQ